VKEPQTPQPVPRAKRDPEAAGRLQIWNMDGQISGCTELCIRGTGLKENLKVHAELKGCIFLSLIFLTWNGCIQQTAPVALQMNKCLTSGCIPAGSGDKETTRRCPFEPCSLLSCLPCSKERLELSSPFMTGLSPFKSCPGPGTGFELRAALASPGGGSFPGLQSPRHSAAAVTDSFYNWKPPLARAGPATRMAGALSPHSYRSSVPAAGGALPLCAGNSARETDPAGSLPGALASPGTEAADLTAYLVSLQLP
jgi:hypothetical protein